MLQTKNGFTAGLIGAWRMSESSGTSIRDIVRGNTITIAAGVTVNSDYLAFDGGANSYGNIAAFNNTFFNPYELTVSAWFNYSSPAVNLPLVTRTDSGTPNLGWSIYSSNVAAAKARVFVNQSADTTTRKVYDGSQTCFDGTWHHVAFRFNHGIIDMFVDGVCDPSITKTVDGNAHWINPTTAKLVVGGTDISGTPTTGGAIFSMKRLRIYNRAKTNSDIWSIYNLGQ